MRSMNGVDFLKARKDDNIKELSATLKELKKLLKGKPKSREKADSK
jgi:hypothetical protein